jgi:hypothetical protein
VLWLVTAVLVANLVATKVGDATLLGVVRVRAAAAADFLANEATEASKEVGGEDVIFIFIETTAACMHAGCRMQMQYQHASHICDMR